MLYLLILKKQQNLKLSSVANCRWRFMVKMLCRGLRCCAYLVDLEFNIAIGYNFRLTVFWGPKGCIE